MSCECNNIDISERFGSIICGSDCDLADCIKDCECLDDGLIKITGVCSREKLEGMLTVDDTTWTQIVIPEVLCIPRKKPDVEQIISINSRVDILSQKVVKTPQLLDIVDVPIPNSEGTNITGRKLVVEGVLRQKVLYTADVSEQSVHSAHFDVPFSAFIILPVDTSFTNRYKIEPCIEDIFVTIINKRQIFKNVTIFIKATKLTCI